MIELKDLSLRISGKGVIQNLNFEAGLGEKILVKGSVGSGKTVFSKLLSGLIPVFYRFDVRGGIKIFGERDPQKFRSHIHLVMQIPEEQIIFEDVIDEIDNGLELLKKFKAKNLLDKKTSQLSDGEKQLVTLITAFASQKECIVFDEAFSHLHPERVERVLKFILNSERTIFFSDKRFEFGGSNLRILDFGCELLQDNFAFNVEEADSAFNAERGNEVLRAEDVTFSYGGPDVLKGVDLALNEGEIALITGDNGSGKTTLLKVLCGILKPIDGRISCKKSLAISLQHPNYSFSSKTVRDEVPKNLNLKAFKIEKILSRHPHTLSAGEAKLLSVLKTFSSELLLLDEPTVYQTYGFILKLIHFLRKERKSAVIASHDKRLENFVDSVYELKRGRLKEIRC